jgi:hypothetical protein
LILAKLERLAPEIKIPNRPSKSLSEILCTWHRNTAVSLDERLQTLDLLLEREPEAAWQLLLQLLPRGYDVSGCTAVPRWRPKPDVTPITYGEIWQANDELVRRALDRVDMNVTRLCDLVSIASSWSPQQRHRLIDQIQRFSETCGEAKERTQLWQEILKLLSRHRIFAKADWSLPESELVPFDQVLRTLEPQDPRQLIVRLFDQEFPDLPNSRARSFEETAEEVTRARQEVVATIMQQKSIEDVLALGQEAKQSGLLGKTLAEVVRDVEIERQVLERALAAEEPKIQFLGLCYVARRRDIKGPTWSEQILKLSFFNAWPAAKQAEFCLGLPADRSTWQTVSNLGAQAEERYWARARVFIGQSERKEDAEFAVERLCRRGRALDALDQAGAYPDKLSVGTLIRVLEAAAQDLARADKIPADAMLHCYLGRIFDKLRASDDAPEEAIARLEWQYLPLLQFHETPVTLRRWLQRDPEFFATVLAYAFRSEDEEQPDSETSDKNMHNRARRAWDVLQSWHTVPGYRQAGTFNPTELTEWVTRAREMCAAKRRAAIGDDQIGHLLAHAPQEADGVWPHTCVREIIEGCQSSYLESGIHAGRITMRGAHGRNPLEGGRQERELGRQYRTWAKAVRARWPQTAGLLNSLAQTYESLGRFQDVSSERLDLE